MPSEEQACFGSVKGPYGNSRLIRTIETNVLSQHGSALFPIHPQAGQLGPQPPPEQVREGLPTLGGCAELG